MEPQERLAIELHPSKEGSSLLTIAITIIFFSVGGLTRLIVHARMCTTRHQEDDPDNALENKYGKHMVANPLNELLDY